jgi:hypothetical protein
MYKERCSEIFIDIIHVSLINIGMRIDELPIEKDSMIHKARLSSMLWHYYHASGDDEGIDVVRYILEQDCYICSGFGLALDLNYKMFFAQNSWMCDLVDNNVARVSTYVPVRFIEYHGSEFSYMDESVICFYHSKRDENEHSHCRYFFRRRLIRFLNQDVTPLFLYHLEVCAKMYSDSVIRVDHKFNYTNYICRPISYYCDVEFYLTDTSNFDFVNNDLLNNVKVVYLFFLMLTGELLHKDIKIKHSKERRDYMIYLMFRLSQMTETFTYYHDAIIDLVSSL